MKTVMGDILKSKLTGELYKVKKIKTQAIILEDEKGRIRIWIPKKDLGSFFEEVRG